MEEVYADQVQAVLEGPRKLLEEVVQMPMVSTPVAMPYGLWSSEGIIAASTRWQHLESWGKVLQKAVYALNQHPIYSMVSPIA